MPRRRLVRLTAAILVAAALNVGLPAVESPQSTVPLLLDHNRITVAVELRASGGATRTARAWIDTGGTKVVLAEPLARALGVDLSGLTGAQESSVDTRMAVPSMRIGAVALDTEGMAVSVRRGRLALSGVQAECIIPARCLRRLRVVFDYPRRRLTLALAGTMTPRGVRVPCRVNRETGLFMTEGTIDGEAVALGIDTGSAGTWVSDKLTTAWLARHADWRSAIGAAGSTNFFGFPFETKGTLVRLPALTIGTVTTTDVAVLGLTQQLFDWYSQKSAAAVAGFLGAELIARYRLEVDFPAQTCWWEPGPARASRDLDIIGLALRPEMDGSYTIAGVVSRAGKPVVEGVEPGDKLVRVGRLDTLHARMGDVIDALRGRPGEARELCLERGGRRVIVTAKVTRLP